MAITASMVKELRERTGAGMMECKKVLVQTEGDMEAAIEELRIKGAAAADKKAGRIAAEGAIVTASDGNAGALVEINCETDFVTKEDSFNAFAAAVANLALAATTEEVADLSAASLESGETVDAAQRELTAKIGEKISVRRFAKFAMTSLAAISPCTSRQVIRFVLPKKIWTRRY